MNNRILILVIVLLLLASSVSAQDAITPPSADDFQQMAQIALADEYKCREPILVIFGSNHDKDGIRRMRAFVCPAHAPPSEFFTTAR